MKKMILFSVLGLLCLFFKVDAQDTKSKYFKISGIITDDQGTPLKMASVRTLDSEIAVSSDYSGQFVISVEHLPVKLVVSFIGYDAKLVSVTKEHFS